MRAAFVLPLLLALTGCATLSQPEELAWQSLHAVDMAQTVDGMRDSCVREGHPLTRALIGERPSAPEIIGYGVASAGLHLFVSDFLRERGYERAYKVWQFVSVMDSGYAVGRNISIGIRLGAPNKTGCGS